VLANHLKLDSVIERLKEDTLEWQVNKKIDENWIPLGQPYAISEVKGCRHAQAMIKILECQCSEIERTEIPVFTKDEVMNTTDTANYMKLTQKTIRDMARDGKIPAKKIGNTWRFLKSEVHDWLKSESLDKNIVQNNSKQTKSEIEKCRSSRGIECGGLISATKEKEYERVLGLK
jgi:excisionase family DNA binding protein